MSDFEWVRLGEIAAITMGQSPDSETYTDDDRYIPFLQGCGDFTGSYPVTDVFCTSPGKVAKEGSLLVSVRAPVGTTNVADKDYCIGRGLAAVKSNIVSASYLREAFTISASFLHRRAQGSTFDAICAKDLSEMKIPVPKNRRVGEKVTDIIQCINAEVDATQALIDKYTAIKQGMMADLFSRGVDPETKALRPTFEEAPELYHKTRLGMLPKEWDIGLLEEIAPVIDPQPDHRTPPQVKEGIPYVGVGDFTWDERIDAKKCRKVSRNAYLKQQSRFKVEMGDVIFGKIGTIGQPKVIREDGEFALSANVLLIKSGMKGHYIRDVLVSQYTLAQLDKIVNVTSQPAVGIQTMRELMIPMPDAIELELINSKLQSLESYIWSEVSSLNKLKAQKAGLMHDLLTGKVPLPA
ncbi:restriction endonuclease subunit S [Grimontia sp. NTOU-MAR1]|uniref:restriction endonuclease subunit S n=1 Tax=Grimontia sp. NTOU-MAR1 TaxID=3111011 RepID=UPI002DB85292|nr:restriction endonuclease subunit S [Grimontia sp. NTOU-MAR1]WRV99276.1 restriction endonuclease subunit S [Grimontia sp. NTOU-MAR1]